MDFTLKDLLDIPRLRGLLNALDEIQHFPSAILTREGEVLTATGWQDICTKFHRTNPISAAKCCESDRYVEARLDNQAEPIIYQCPMGLVDAAMPIIIEGCHLGNVFTGQLFTEPPDEQRFSAQAREYGFNETAYLDALKQVPHFSEERIRKNLHFIHGLAQMLAEQGLQFRRLRETENELRDSKEKYQNVFENLQEVYYETSLEGVILEVSPSVESIFGFQRDELLGKPLRDLYVDYDERTLFLQKILADGCVRNYEVHLKGGDGAVRVCALSSALIKDPQGAPHKLVGSIRDISETKQAEETLRVQNRELKTSQTLLQESEERFRALHDASFGGVIIHDHGLILDCNQALSDMTGYSLEELIGMDGLNLIAPSHLDLVLKNIKRGYTLGYEVEGLRKDGSTYPLAIRGKNIRYKGREVRVIEFRDITQRKAAEDALEAERQRLSEIIRGTNVGTWEWNFQTGELILNERWAEILGYTLEELRPINIARMEQMIHPDDRQGRKERLQRHFSGMVEHYEAEFRLKHKEDKWIWVLARGKVSSWTKDNAPLQLYGSLADINERKRLEEERQTLEKLNTVGTLAGGIAHDFNNILAGLYGNLSLAKARLGKENPSYRFLDAAEKSMNRATLLTNQLLTFAKGGAPVKESLRLSELVEEVVNFNLAGSNVKPVLNVPADLWLVKADEGQIQQVFGNLAINAMQAMPDGGHLYVSLENCDLPLLNSQNLNEGKYLKISFADEGVGIAEEHLSRIFEPYFTTKKTGSGLGLATLYSIITKHGGTVRVDSEADKGTTFTLYLPASNEPEKPVTDDENTGPTAHAAAKILIMDDEVMILSTLTAMLKELGHSVASASEGQQALSLYLEALDGGSPFDLVLLDLTIPGGMGGKEVARNILELNPEARIIISSGYADDPIMPEFAKHGFKGVVLKPYTLEKLSKALDRVLGG